MTKPIDKSVITPKTVDLGLSVIWTDVNLGATSMTSPGDYYAWGETEPWYSIRTGWKSGYESGFSANWSKANMNGKGFDLTGDYFQYDAAHAALGDGYRLPTKAEVEELFNNGKTTITDQGNGYLLTSKVEGYTDNRIFIPKSGYFETTTLTSSGNAYFWTREHTQKNYARQAIVVNGNAPEQNAYLGTPIRAVKEKPVTE